MPINLYIKGPNMFPETFFFDLVMLIMATYVISVCVIYFVLRVLDKKVKI